MEDKQGITKAVAGVMTDALADGRKPATASNLLKGYPEFLSSLLIGKRYDGSFSLPIAVFQIQDKCRIEKIKYINGF